METELALAQEETEQLRGQRRGRLRLGVYEAQAAGLPPGLLPDMHRHHLGLRFINFVDLTPQMVRRMNDGDVAPGPGDDVPAGPEPATRAALRRRTCLITAPDHPLASRRKVRLEEIAGENFIFPDPSPALHEMLQDALRRSGVGPPRS